MTRLTSILPSLLVKANILIDHAGCARLADFGLLTIISDPRYLLSSSSHTQGGTVRWMSPERIAPERFGFRNSRPTISSDCYALGMVIYETISGNVPFHKDADLAVSMKVVEGKHPPRGVKFTENLWGTLELCWASMPNNRPSIKDVLRCLETTSSLLEPPSPRENEGVYVDGEDWDSETGSSGRDSLDSFTTDDHVQLPPTCSTQCDHLIVRQRQYVPRQGVAMESFEPKKITFRKGGRCGIPVDGGISRDYRDLEGRDSRPFEVVDISDRPTLRIEVSS